MRGDSIRRPLALALGAGVVAIAAVAASVIGNLYERDMEAAGFEAMRSSHAMFTALERGDVRKMDAALSALAEDHELTDLFVARDQHRLLAAAMDRFTKLKRDGITHWYFIDPDRRVFLRVHKPELSGDAVRRLTLDKAIESGSVGAGLELGQTAFALRVVRPWTKDGKLIGYLELAEEIDHFLVRMKQETGNEFGLLVKKQYLDQEAWARMTGPARNTWNARPDVVVVDTTTFSDGIIDFQGDLEALPDEGRLLGEELRTDRAWIRGIFPVRDAGGRKVGALAVMNDFTRMHAVATAARIQVLVLVLGMSALACAVVWAALEWFILRRLGALAAAAEREAGLSPPPGEDELGRLEAVLARRAGEPGRRAG